MRRARLQPGPELSTSADWRAWGLLLLRAQRLCLVASLREGLQAVTAAIPMRISAISDWTTCEAMALTDPRPEARVHVAAWVGTLAHALLGGVDEPKEPGRLRFDAITPTAHAARIQAKGISAVASRCLEREGWSIMEAEREMRTGDTTGHLDILAWHGETKRTAIIDLKTGQGAGAGWLQVGGYIQLLGDESGVWPAVECGGILHAPRTPVRKELIATLEIRDATGLEEAWEVARERIGAVLAGATALRSPGLHCGRCTASCPVRIRTARPLNP